MSEKPNRLAHEKSPYLLQHAHNPVDWHPWGEEAFALAKSENKPIFLSIGYSTCHWCHVMEKESFEDTKVAELLNRFFVSIKVDREERPDVDSVYMSVCQMLTQRGGWPLTIFLTPEKKPFFAATYIPKTHRFGQVGLMQLLPQIAELWGDRQTEMLESAEKIISALQESNRPTPISEAKANSMEDAFNQLSQNFDRDRGGFTLAPKFPTPHHLTFLLRYWKRTGSQAALAMVEKTLTAMRRGGIYDQVGFGFHRYSTDASWFLPHFEKMLYDQALLAMAYTETYQVTKQQIFRQTAEEIFSYVLRDMTSKEGGFYSAEDADSEGVEGKFYTWSSAEVEQTLNPQEFDIFKYVFNPEKDGNFQEEADKHHTGRNILYRNRSLEAAAADLGIDLEALLPQLEKIRTQLLAVREKRIRPLRDEKILTDWNGLMIAALAKSARVFENTLYAEAAIKAAEFLKSHMFDKNQNLLHRYKDGESSIQAFADDYAFSIWGMLELYETTFNPIYLQLALEWNDQFLARFWDEKAGGFFFTSDQAESLFIRKKELYDGAIPSSNSVAMLNLLRLGRLTGNAELEAKAAQMQKYFSGDVVRFPSAYTQWLSALDFSQGPSYEIVIKGKSQAQDTKKMLKMIQTEFLPHVVVIFIPTEKDSAEIIQLAPFAAKMEDLGTQATAYVCTQFACQEPTTSIQELSNLIK